jgi:hypothetical protein
MHVLIKIAVKGGGEFSKKLLSVESNFEVVVEIRKTREFLISTIRRKPPRSAQRKNDTPGCKCAGRMPLAPSFSKFSATPPAPYFCEIDASRDMLKTTQKSFLIIMVLAVLVS